MSYESKMLEDLKMPSRNKVEEALLKELVKHNGIIKEFKSGEEIVEQLADDFDLNKRQRSAYLRTIYIKENREKKSSLWHRLLFRAAYNLAKNKLILRPTITLKITNNREWMLTEKGFDEALKLLKIPLTNKEFLPTKSFEVQKIVNKLKKTLPPANYNPINKRKTSKIFKEVSLRKRGFRQAVIEAYDFRCAVCGLKICSPDSLYWEVEAAHIVPHNANGKSDIWNGLALCHLHHWAFDVGWFTLLDNYKIQVSSRVNSLSSDLGKIEDYEIIKSLSKMNSQILLPVNENIYPHHNSIKWHRQNIFY